MKEHLDRCKWKGYIYPYKIYTINHRQSIIECVKDTLSVDSINRIMKQHHKHGLLVYPTATIHIHRHFIINISSHPLKEQNKFDPPSSEVFLATVYYAIFSKSKTDIMEMYWFFPSNDCRFWLISKDIFFILIMDSSSIIYLCWHPNQRSTLNPIYSPGKIHFERSPFKLTQDMVYLKCNTLHL